MSTINSLDHSTDLRILGYFNYNWLEWSCSNNNSFGSLNLTQLITEPTRVDSISSSLLNCLVSHPKRITSSGVLPDSFSDYSMVYCVWKITIPHLPPKFVKVRQSKTMNSELFIQDIINLNWHRFQLIPFVEDYFCSELTKIINKPAPWKVIKVPSMVIKVIKDICPGLMVI